MCFTHFMYVVCLQKQSANRATFKRYHLRKYPAIPNKSINGVTNATAHISTTSTSTTINSIYEYSEEKHFEAEHDFQLRREHLWQMCNKYDYIQRYEANAWEFFISFGHGIAWCNVFKAASSTWMYYFNILGKAFCWVGNWLLFMLVFIIALLTHLCRW